MFREMILGSVGAVTIVTANAQSSQTNEEELAPTWISFSIIGRKIPAYIEKKKGGEIERRYRDKKYCTPFGVFEIPAGGLEKDDDGNDKFPKIIDAPQVSLGKPYMLKKLTQKKMVLNTPEVNKDHSLNFRVMRKLVSFDIKFPNLYQNVYIYQTGLNKDWSKHPKLHSLNNSQDSFPDGSVRVTNLTSFPIAFSLGNEFRKLKKGTTLLEFSPKIRGGAVVYKFALLNDNGAVLKKLSSSAFSMHKKKRVNIVLFDQRQVNKKKAPVSYSIFNQKGLPKVAPVFSE